MLPNCLLYAVALIFTGLLLFLLIYFVSIIRIIESRVLFTSAIRASHGLC